MFKNLTLYRIGADGVLDLTTLDEALSRMRFTPCGSTQQKSVGWVEPRGQQHARLVESVQGQWVMRLMTEQRIVPGAVVKQRTEELALQVEQSTGRKPGKKQNKELKEQALLELLPLAFTKQSATWVWLDPRQRLLMVDAGSLGIADEVASTLVKAADGKFQVGQLHTADSPAVCMSEWLATAEAPASFTIDRDCELKSADAQKSVVRYTRHRLDTDEVREHILSGKTPTRLAMTWRDRVSFVLSDTGQIRKLAFLDGVFEAHKGSAQATAEESFDADVAIATGEIGQLLPDLVDALGGEADPLERGRSSDAPQDAGVAQSPVPTGMAAATPLEVHPAPTTNDDSPPW